MLTLICVEFSFDDIRKSGVTVPVAIELESEGEDMRVYTANDTKEVSQAMLR